MKKHEGLALARRYLDALKANGVPVQRVIVYGSVARDDATEESDLDIAVIGRRFAASRHLENMRCRRIRWNIDTRIEPICLHPDDFREPAFALPREIARTGIEVYADFTITKKD